MRFWGLGGKQLPAAVDLAIRGEKAALVQLLDTSLSLAPKSKTQWNHIRQWKFSRLSISMVGLIWNHRAQRNNVGQKQKHSGPVTKLGSQGVT